VLQRSRSARFDEALPIVYETHDATPEDGMSERIANVDERRAWQRKGVSTYRPGNEGSAGHHARNCLTT
jgi:hypothetical protein